MNNDLAQVLQAVSEQAARQASALNDLRKAVEEESLQTLANVKDAATQTIGEISSQIERQANALNDLREAAQEESAKTLAKAKSDANQAIRAVSEQVGRDMEALNDLRKSLVEESAQALPKFQEDLGQVMGEVNDQVQQQVNMLCSLMNLIEKDSAQIFSKVKSDLAEALAENSRLAEQHMKSTQASLSDWETRMGSRIESQLQQLEGKTRTSLETLQEQSAELLESTLEKLRNESRALPEQLEVSLKKAAGDIEQIWVERIQGKQQQMADEIIEASAAQLGKQMEENLDLFGEELKLKQEQAARGVAEALGTLQEQSVELLKSTLEELRSESRALPEQLEASLKKAAGNIEQIWVERIQGKQQQMADEIIEASAARLGKQLQENLELFGEELKLKQEQAANGVAEAFRSKMIEILSVFQSPPGSSRPPAQPPSPDTPSL
jgi:3-dehydroquinate dehydratase